MSAEICMGVAFNYFSLAISGGSFVYTIIFDPNEQYIWLLVANICIGVDGTTNFAHGYPSFAVSIAVLFQGNPAAASVVIIT